jgi:hypothetical protein
MTANQGRPVEINPTRSPDLARRAGELHRRPALQVRGLNGFTVVDIQNAESLFAGEDISDLSAQLHSLVETGHIHLVLNFRGVRSMSSDVLGTLAGLHRRLERS